VSRAKAALGYAPTTALEDGIAKYWAYLSSRSC
jgi:nucleoside-diphosphate-sugar epimerase